MIRFSVVIPAYNEELLIRESLESIKNQDFSGEYEVIVVDNGSKDNTAKIARDMGIKVVDCERKGVSNARQAGAEAASGEIIVQADADTIYPKWWLSRIDTQFNRHSKAQAVAGTFIYKTPPWWAWIEYFLRTFSNILSSVFFGRPFIISGANFAFKKNALLSIGGYDQNSYSSDQFNISTRLNKVGKVVYDRKSWCKTSNRSVAKPLGQIIRDFLGHLGHFTKHQIEISRQSIRTQREGRRLPIGVYLKLVVPLFLIGILCYGYFVPASPVFGKVYYRSLTDDKVIALTFDDGPNEPYTSQILDILAENNIQATFFLIGTNVALYPDIARRIVSEGNIIGNHSYTHNANHALYFDAFKDIQAAQLTIYEVTGVEPHLYRPPHGKKSPWELEEIENRGYVEVLWSITTNDQSGRPAAYLAHEIVRKARSGGVILLHDGFGTLHNVRQSDKQVTVEMLPLIINELKNEGYTFLTIPELFNIRAYNQVQVNK
jgi:peptidoglycan/xylan/chitin deacetylase (PgdA/CDA1 family)